MSTTLALVPAPATLIRASAAPSADRPQALRLTQIAEAIRARIIAEGGITTEQIVDLLKGAKPAPTLEGDCEIVLNRLHALEAGVKRRRLAQLLPAPPQWAIRAEDGSTRLDRALAALVAVGRIALHYRARGSVRITVIRHGQTLGYPFTPGA